MASEKVKPGGADRDRVNSGGWSSGAGAGQNPATVAAARRAGEENRVPPLTDFTDAHPLPLLTKKPDQLKGAVETARPVKDIVGHLDKKT
jgi:hypothetical protein